MSKSPITTHVLDTSTGYPAQGIRVQLLQQTDTGWVEIANGITNADGRIADWLESTSELPFGLYKVSFDLDGYYACEPPTSFYPLAEIVFRLQDRRHHHIPLLLTPYGYSTYRGS